MGLRKVMDLSGELRILEDEMEEFAMENDGDVTEFPFEERIEKMKKMKQEELISFGVWHKLLMADISEWKGEMAPFQSEVKRIQALINKCQRKADFAKYVLQQFAPQGIKIESTECTLGWRKNTSLNIPKDVTPELLEEQEALDGVDFVKTDKAFRKREISKHIREFGDIVIQIPGNEIMGVDAHEETISIPNHKNIQIK